MFHLSTQCLICMIKDVQWHTYSAERMEQHLLLVHNIELSDEPEA